MAEWFAKYPNDNGEYEITFRGSYKEVKIIEEMCQTIIDRKPENLYAVGNKYRLANMSEIPAEVKASKYHAFTFIKIKEDK